MNLSLLEKKVFGQITSMNEEIIQRLQELVQIPSVVGQEAQAQTYYSGHKESNNLHRDIVILRVLRGAELTSQSAFERNIQPAWQSLKLLTRRYLNSGQGNKRI